MGDEIPRLDEDFVKGATSTESSARQREKRPGPIQRWKARRAGKKRRREMVKAWRPEAARNRKGGLVIAPLLIGIVVATGVWLVNADAWRSR